MENLSDFEIEEKYFDPLYEMLYKDKEGLLKRITPEQFQVLCVIQFSNQLSNGGFFQYFWNSEAKNFAELILGLKLTSNDRVLEIVLEAWEKIEPGLKYIIEQKKQHDLDGYDETINQFDFLNDLEQKTFPQYEIYDKAIEYVRHNPQYFHELN